MNIKFIAKVVGEIEKNIGKPLTILQISKNSGLSYNAAYRTVQFLEKEKVVQVEKVGPSTVVKLNYSPRTQGFIAIAQSYEDEEE
jgi:hypothetical protein